MTFALKGGRVSLRLLYRASTSCFSTQLTHPAVLGFQPLFKDSLFRRINDGSDPRTQFALPHRFFGTKNGEDGTRNEETPDITLEIKDMPASEDDELSKDIPELDRSLFTEEIKVRMPDMGEGEGKILKWYKKEGDVVQRRDVLCDIETPDFAFGMETQDEGYAIMGKIFFDAPSEPIKDGDIICILLHESSKQSKEAEH